MSHFFLKILQYLMLLCLMTASVIVLPRTGQAAPSKSVIVVGGDRNYPPYEFLDKDGKPAGFNVELTRAIAEVMGLNVEIRLGKWDELRQGLQNGSVDILQGMVQSAQRSKQYDFSPPHSIVHQSVFGRRGAPRIFDVSELKGKEVLVQRGGFLHDYLIEKKVEAKLFLVDTHVEAMRQLASGKRDYALVGNLPGLYLSRELGLSNIAPAGKLFAGQPYCYAVVKGNDELLTQFNEGLAILKNTGRYNKIYDKWLGALEPAAVSWPRIIKYATITALPLLLALMGFVYLNRVLKKEVAHRTRELQLQQQQLIQADKMASLGILVSGVAHEINNPTGLLLFNLPVLKKIYGAVEEQLEKRYEAEGDFMISGLSYTQLRQDLPLMIDEMFDGATRIKRIVEDLKDFARKDNSALDECVALNDVVRASLRLADNSINKATRQVVSDLAPSLPCFKGNSQRVEQVVVNLILNACQALADPGKEIRLATRHDPERDRVVLTVSDEGVGIPEENLRHVTDPFFTTKRDTGGTGLGLSVSAGIVKDHNGTLTFESVPLQGTTVTVTFPAARS